ncbi:acetyl-CoA hydrolase/transferase C-terminal domain-containing protein [Accumulibacter sp.]|uniref:acetyl-CoA hydrolase/transferase C-terminal domain-containing protein n=1 Tax=Accumulibacter sp. TaxID=2053492 RepID=UPI00261D7EAA|nr:acetyl-CoA hydrolase/transferase C-terminal domain-containing protein [Accumulibacter sp.]
MVCPGFPLNVYITEYGVADVRGQSDAEVIKRLLAISDSWFQDELLARAKANGKIDKDYQIPASQRLAECAPKASRPTSLSPPIWTKPHWRSPRG